MLKVNDTVEWTSSSAGITRSKRGLVVEVIPANQFPTREKRVEADVWGNIRNHESYLVRVPGKNAASKGKLYWPRVSQLKRDVAMQTSATQAGTHEIDLQSYYARLANKELFSEDEMVALLKALAHYQKATAYLAHCNAATLETTPKSMSLSQWSRLFNICKASGELALGDPQSLGFQSHSLSDAAERCNRACQQPKQG